MAFNKLTDAQDERLALLSEECAEVIKAIAKIQRHGYASRNPYDPRAGTNRDMLTTELGDVAAAVEFLIAAGDLARDGIEACCEQKIQGVSRWLHHQPSKLLRSVCAVRQADPAVAGTLETGKADHVRQL